MRPEKPVSPRWSTTIRMVAPDASSESDAGRVIVEEKGRKRGFHDYQSDFFEPQLSPKCSFVVFGWHGEIWVADARVSGAAAPLVVGGASALFFEPPAP